MPVDGMLLSYSDPLSNRPTSVTIRSTTSREDLCRKRVGFSDPSCQIVYSVFSEELVAGHVKMLALESSRDSRMVGNSSGFYADVSSADS